MNSPQLNRGSKQLCLMHLLIRWSLVSLMLFTTGCASMGVKPWERNLLAREDMLLDADALDLAFDEHIYFSKEASSGGQGFAGGGCGCN